MAETIYSGVFATMPDEEPERSTITFENIFDPATPYEQWLLKLVWSEPRRAMVEYERYIETLPVFAGPEDNSDVLAPGVETVKVPRYWTSTKVHFTDHNDPRWLRVSLVSGSYYTFTHAGRAHELFTEIHGGHAPRRIIDLGCGLGGSTFALARLFPEAQVIGVDLRPEYIRADRARAERDGLTNVEFYRGNAQETWYADGEFDIVNESYVLHEMPQVEAHRFVDEMHRLLRPGGRLSVIDVIYDDTEDERQARVQRSKGPEPFLAEYMRLNIQQHLAQAGFDAIEKRFENGWDAMVLVAVKPG